jgi:hypothetical protein
VVTLGVGAGNVRALRWAGNVEGADAKRCTGRRQEAATVTVSSVGGGRREGWSSGELAAWWSMTMRRRHWQQVLYA